MRIVHVHNSRLNWGGEDRTVDLIDSILIKNGNEVFQFRKSLKNLGTGFLLKIKAFLFGFFSFSTYKEISHILNSESISIVHVHNINPQITPSLLIACKRARVPVVKHMHDYGLTCPITSHFRDGKICTKCLNGREYWCAIKNCRGEWIESIAYTFRSWIFRKANLIKGNVTLFIALTEFAKKYLVDQGYNGDQIEILPNPVFLPELKNKHSISNYVAFVGRIEKEKGIDILLETAKLLINIPIKLAGDGSLRHHFEKIAPQNMKFVGMLEREKLPNFYLKSRFLVFPSICYEGFPNTILEAMSYGLPIIASNIGGIQEIIDDGITGLLHEPGNYLDLAKKVELLWNNISLCRKMGESARQKVSQKYSDEVYFKRLKKIYHKAINQYKSTN